MRLWHLGALAVVAATLLTLTGCPNSTSNPGGGGGNTDKEKPADKLKSAVEGKWEGKMNDKKVTYEFKKDGKFEFDGDKLKFSGTWSVPDDKHVELKYKLTDEQLKEAKELKMDPEPKADNDDKRTASVKDDELTLGGEKLKKAK
jgi:hypothetical protein